MKLIHCADIHLDSVMKTHLTSEQAEIRKMELLQTFLHMIAFAAKEQVKAILIAGDLFDTEVVSPVIKARVLDAINRNSKISFFYLKGNHDRTGEIEKEEKLPDNLYLFSDQWKSYELHEPQSEKKVVITGVELTEKNRDTLDETLQLEKEPFQIVMLHGQLVNHDGKMMQDQISLSALEGKQIDYLAMGHIHKQQSGRIDGRGMYCYSGCLEGRGFDECGAHGCMLLDIDVEQHTYTAEFHPIARRKHHWISVDVTNCMDSISIEKRIQHLLKEDNVEAADLVRIELVGEIPVDAEKNLTYLYHIFAEQFFYLELKDHTTLKVNTKEYALDASLKGEFVRTVETAEELSEQTKAEVIRMGLQFLTGTEPEI